MVNMQRAVNGMILQLGVLHKPKGNGCEESIDSIEDLLRLVEVRRNVSVTSFR